MTQLTALGKSPAAQTARRAPRRSRRAIVLNLVAVVIGLVVWTLLATLGVQGLPGPLEVAAKAGELIADGTLFTDALASLRRVLIGFLLGTLLAIPVGFLMGWYATARGLLEPYVQFFRTIPRWRSSRWPSCSWASARCRRSS
ncbi:ABC transporter permease [Nonomuraea thailandensis]